MTTAIRIITTHNSSKPQLTARVPRQHILLLLLQLLLQVMLPLTLMPSMEATRTIWLCGMHLLPNNSNREARARPVPRLALIYHD